MLLFGNQVESKYQFIQPTIIQPTIKYHIYLDIVNIITVI